MSSPRAADSAAQQQPALSAAAASTAAPPSDARAQSGLSSSLSSSSSSIALSLRDAHPVLLRQQSVLAVRGVEVALSSLPADEQRVVSEYRRLVSVSPHVAIAVCAIQALTGVVRLSSATTMMGLEKELQRAVGALKACNPASISLAAGCELFSRYVTRAALDIPRFDECVSRVLERGEQFSSASLHARAAIAELVDRFLADGAVVLIHGFSRVVHAVLLHAAQRGKNFSVVVTEGRPNCDGYHAAAELIQAGIPCTLILDSAVAYSIGGVDLVLIGAEGVAESGGVINKIGTLQMCLTATAVKKPVYVCAESFKFARLFPLHQQDLPETKEQQPKFKPAVSSIQTNGAEQAADAAAAAPASAASHSSPSPSPSPSSTVFGVSPAAVQSASSYLFSPSRSAAAASACARLLTTSNPSCDYTPPEYLTLLFTDIGILTPSAVSDELIKLYL